MLTNMVSICKTNHIHKETSQPSGENSVRMLLSYETYLIGLIQFSKKVIITHLVYSGL